MARFWAALLGLILAGPADAACRDLNFFPENGLYYSVTGKEKDARKLDLPVRLPTARLKPVVSIGLEGAVPWPYSVAGRFFLRSGARGENWLLVPPRAGQDAVLIRRHTASDKALPADFVSVYRATLEAGLCPGVGVQPGYGGERNFVRANDYLAYHLGKGQRRRNRELNETFHFRYTGGRLTCVHSADVRAPDGTADATTLAFVGRDDLRLAPSGQILIDRGVIDLARVFEPAPAYALPAPGQARVPRMVVSSMEVSLHRITPQRDVCIGFPAPAPTFRAANGLFQWLFDRVQPHQRRALRMAAQGEWVPRVSEFYLMQVEAPRQSALLKLHWARQE